MDKMEVLLVSLERALRKHCDQEQRQLSSRAAIIIAVLDEIVAMLPASNNRK